MNFLYDLPDELIEYIFIIVHKQQYKVVLKELKERTIMRNNERLEEWVQNFVDNLIDDVLQNLNTQL